MKNVYEILVFPARTDDGRTKARIRWGVGDDIQTVCLEAHGKTSLLVDCSTKIDEIEAQS